MNISGAPDEDARAPRPLDEYTHPADKMFSMYMKEAEKVDRQMVEDWKGTTDGILIFAGLFSAVVTAFLIESYKSLSPDTEINSPTVALLAQISSQLAAIANSSQPSNIQPPPPKDAFHPSTTALAVNAMWFLSLSLSLVCALAATLVQYWARCYIRSVERFQQSPHKRALIRALMFEGLEWSHVGEIVDAIPTLIHIALFLFLTGLVTFLHEINLPIAYFVLAILSSCTILYTVAAILPLFRPESTLRTPFSSALWYTWQYCSRLLPSPRHDTTDMELAPYNVLDGEERTYREFLASNVVGGGLVASTAQSSPQVVSTQHLPVSISRAQEQCASVDGWLNYETQKRMAKALAWVRGLANEDREFEAFLMAIPGLLAWQSSLPQHLAENDTQLLVGIRKFFCRTISFFPLGPAVERSQKIRAIACMEAWHHLTITTPSYRPTQLVHEWKIQKEPLLFVYNLMDYIRICDKEDVSLVFCTITGCLTLWEPTLAAITGGLYFYDLNRSRQYIDELIRYTVPASPAAFSPFEAAIRALPLLSLRNVRVSSYKHILTLVEAIWQSVKEPHQEISLVKFLDKLLVEYYPHLTHLAEFEPALSYLTERWLKKLIQTTTFLNDSMAKYQAISVLSKYLDSNPVFGVAIIRTTLEDLKAGVQSDPTEETPSQEEGSPIAV